MNMDLLIFAFVAVIPFISDAFTVHGPSGPLVVPLGSSVVLPCYVDEPLLKEDLEVKWERTDSATLVQLYMDGESRPEVQDQDYHDRAHFFTDQIQHGNFSLRLDKLRAEDEGKYTCKVYSQQDSGETVVQIKDVERLLVSGSNQSISVSVGEDITLNCSVDSHFTPEHIEEVSWKKTDDNIVVLLYLNNEILPESSDEQYRDRVEFFTDEIPKGNFSLRLKSVRAEDKGVYMCQVFAGGLSFTATVVLERLGFSVSHIMVLILCISASGSALLLCFLIYYRLPNTDPTATKYVRTLGFLHVFLPNIMMFVAFVLWGLTDGFLYETVSCCALYILRPLMLIYAAPYLEKMSGLAILSEFVIFMVVYCSVIFGRAFQPAENSFGYPNTDIAIFAFGSLTPLFVVYIIYILTKMKRNPCSGETCKYLWDKVTDVAVFSYFVLPSLQFILFLAAFGIYTAGNFFIIFPVFFFLSFSCLRGLNREKSCSNLVANILWIIYMFIITVLVVLIYMSVLIMQKDGKGLLCMTIFQKMLWMSIIYIDVNKDLDLTLNFKKVFYVFGSVVVVLVNSVTLMTELILKIVNGKRAVGDLRVTVFSSESIFTFFLLISIMFGPWFSNMQCCQNANKTQANESVQKTVESQEMNPLLNSQDQDAGRSDVAEETQPDSVESQT